MNGLRPADISGRRAATEPRIANAITLLTIESLAIIARGSPVRKLTAIPATLTASMSTGLRERRKQQTRQAISDMATEMFAARGFDEVTIAQVAEAAGVAKMTVTNYFPRKEDLVFDRAEAIVRGLADVIKARAPGESMLAAIRRDFADRVARADVTLGLSSPAFARMIENSPALTSRGLEMIYQREHALGDAIAAETGVDDPQVRLVAALLASVHQVLYAEASRRSQAGEPRRRSAPPWRWRLTARSTCSSRPWATTASGR
jgi:AcrR family transcriptional regulator